jgi:hypothetical protein
MRFPCIAALLFSTATAFAQTGLWSHVGTEARPQQLQPATLTDAQLKSVASLLRHQKPDNIWECEGPDLDEVINGLRFEAIPMPSKQEVVLAEAPAGCARGGQGANGAMWVIRFDEARATLLATPEAFSGWIFAVLPTMSHGYPDIVTGWHMSAAEAGLSYMRFDGRLYRSIGGAKLVTDDEQNRKIVPEDK